MLYLSVILTANLCIALLASLGTESLPICFLHTGIATAEVIALDGLFAFLLRRLPERWFSPESERFMVSKKEKNFWRKLQISKWEKKIPELGCFTGFHKKRLEKRDDESYLRRFILETNYGALIHLENALFGILIWLLPWNGGWKICLPVAAVNAFLSFLPFAVLRNNTAPLQLLYRLAKKKTRDNPPSTTF